MLDNHELGKTPYSGSFDYYGKRKIQLVKDGYETQTHYIDLKPPWYQWPFIDFFSEVVIPYEITDDHKYRFNMKQQRIVSDDELMARAFELRDRSHAGNEMRINGNPVQVTSPLIDPNYQLPPPATQMQPDAPIAPYQPLVPPSPQRSVEPYRPGPANVPDSPYSPIYIPGAN